MVVLLYLAAKFKSMILSFNNIASGDQNNNIVKDNSQLGNS